MQDNCILCGQEVQRGGFSARIEGVVLRPLCPDCDAMCSKEPKRVMDEHRDLFEAMQRRESVIPPVIPPKAHTATPERSQRERSVSNRYNDAYRVANAAVVFGNTVKTIGGVLAALIFIPALLFALTPLAQMSGNGLSLAFGAVLLGAIFGGTIGIIFFVLGTLLGAVGQHLRAALDAAVNTSPFLGDDLRAEIMSL